ncbi:MAG: hypothetical protein IT462_03150 [Planctomycetes bacterium]|nr:hypothetical protein [Planctomycetota bacterium]
MILFGRFDRGHPAPIASEAAFLLGTFLAAFGILLLFWGFSVRQKGADGAWRRRLRNGLRSPLGRVELAGGVICLACSAVLFYLGVTNTHLLN